MSDCDCEFKGTIYCLLHCEKGRGNPHAEGLSAKQQKAREKREAELKEPGLF